MGKVEELNKEYSLEPRYTSLVYRRCERVFSKLVENNLREISLKNLTYLIKKYIGGSQKTVETYLQNFVYFDFLKRHPIRNTVYVVNYEKDFFLHLKGGIKETRENVDFQPLPQKNQNIRLLLEEKVPQSKTLVYLENRGAKRSCSFKGYKRTWKRFVKRTHDLGLDVCYVMDAWMNAFLVATGEARKLIQTPVQVGFSTLIVNVILPYVVQRPRRRRRRLTLDEEEEY